METEKVQEFIDSFFSINPLNPKEYIFWCDNFPVVGIELLLRNDEILLNNIRVLQGFEKKCYATKVLKILQRISDETMWQISGIIEANGKCYRDNQNLKNYYEKRGFKIIKNQIFYFPKTWYNN